MLNCGKINCGKDFPTDPFLGRSRFWVLKNRNIQKQAGWVIKKQAGCISKLTSGFYEGARPLVRGMMLNSLKKNKKTSGLHFKINFWLWWRSDLCTHESAGQASSMLPPGSRSSFAAQKSSVRNIQTKLASCIFRYFGRKFLRCMRPGGPTKERRHSAIRLADHV